MMMVEVTSVAGSALPVAALADHLRLSRGFADDGSQDGQLESCLRAAASAIEARTGKALFRRRFALTLVHWQEDEAHVLPLAPVDSIDSVKLISRAGAETVVADTDYDLSPDLHAPTLVARGRKLPSPSQGGTIEVEFTAGFSTDWADLPADLKQAVLILGGQFWGQDMEPEKGIPFSVSVLLEPYRALRLRGVSP